MNTPKLELFYFDSCPFCQIVLQAIKELNIKVDYKDIFSDQQNLERLVSDTGRRTVPCLYIDNKPMHESSDIIQWLKSNADKLEKN
ncbi:glutathione S-transferase N-terminal domain-containing protein [Halobacteriovorax sp. GB3]|uniref:glutaredoxin family protein n=1 Tax=Halobacteriovorax sp. GB3 TaxID=2719615 RepID=UPI0023617ED9|nr:glutathione S-transferase N-terminal domain-containing protein [Halobacteriovorax sp. GB3]MDD0852670.1 glutathione S-transferase N-terminal domain-containing protein [Halobacteriovorax sp. GB3]